MTQRIVPFLLCFWAACSPVFPQTIRGSIKGTVTDSSGAPVPSVRITARTEDGRENTTVTGADGSYLLNLLPGGRYTVTAEAPALQQLQPASVTVTSSAVTLNIALAVSVNKQQITVEEAAGPVLTTDPSQNAGAVVMRGEVLQALADDPDDLQADLAALAGPAAGPDGATFYIDGFSAGDAPLPNKDAIREIRVNQNPFAPEFDAIGFGRVEILTKPGSDQLRGTTYFDYGNGALDSRNPYAAQKPPFDEKEYGGTLAGPIRKKASFFTDIDRRDIGSGSVINAITLDPSTLTIVPYTQVASSPLDRLRLSSRLDYQLNESNTLVVRYTVQRDENRNIGVGNFNLPSQAYQWSEWEHAFEGTETAVLNSNVVNETHFQFRHQHYMQSAADSATAIVVANSFNGGGSLTGLHDYIHHHYEVQNYTTAVQGHHSWKFGIRLRAVDIQDTSRQNFNGTYTFGGDYAPLLNADNMPEAPGIVCNADVSSVAGCGTISSIEQYRRTLLFEKMGLPASEIRSLGGGPTQFSINAGDPFVHAGGVDAGLFAGDDWHWRPNLTVSAGLRYETQDNIGDHADWAPRLAFAWAPGTVSKTTNPKYVIRGGFGLFYERFSEQNVLMAQRFDGKSQRQYVITDPDTFPAMPSLASLQGVAQSETLHTISSTLRTPYVIQSAIGVEHQLPGHTTIALNYINTHGLHELLSRNINAPLPGTYVGVPGSGVYPYGNVGPVEEMESAGLYNQNQLNVNVNSQANSVLSLFGYYSLNYARSNTDGVGTFPANQYDLHDEYGPAATDVRNRANFGGTFVMRGGVRLSPFVSAQSGAPFNIVTSEDVYGDDLLTARPGIASNADQPGVISTAYGLLNSQPALSDKIVGRNSGRSPGQFVVNMRLAKTFGFGPERSQNATAKPLPRYNLILSISARNLLNHVNPGPVVGNINSPFFGESTQIAGGTGAFGGSSNNRRIELQARLSF